VWERYLDPESCRIWWYHRRRHIVFFEDEVTRCFSPWSCWLDPNNGDVAFINLLTGEWFDMGRGFCTGSLRD
jgi:hypothetical protein